MTWCGRYMMGTDGSQRARGTLQDADTFPLGADALCLMK
jgi:hypothetical protein